MHTISYRYAQKKWIGPACALFFAGCTWVLVGLAKTNSVGLIINHMIELEPGSATIFYWVLAAFSAIMTAGGIILSAAAFQAPGEIILGESEISLPKSRLNAKTMISIPYAAIKRLEHVTVQRQEFLHIYHGQSKQSVIGGMLPTKVDFEALCTELAGRVQSNR